MWDLFLDCVLSLSAHSDMDKMITIILFIINFGQKLLLKLSTLEIASNREEAETHLLKSQKQ